MNNTQHINSIKVNFTFRPFRGQAPLLFTVQASFWKRAASWGRRPVVASQVGNRHLLLCVVAFWLLKGASEDYELIEAGASNGQSRSHDDTRHLGG